MGCFNCFGLFRQRVSRSILNYKQAPITPYGTFDNAHSLSAMKSFITKTIGGTIDTKISDHKIDTFYRNILAMKYETDSYDTHNLPMIVSEIILKLVPGTMLTESDINDYFRNVLSYTEEFLTRVDYHPTTLIYFTYQLNDIAKFCYLLQLHKEQNPDIHPESQQPAHKT